MAKLLVISFFVACFMLAAQCTDSKHEKRLLLHSETDIAGEMVKLQQEFAALQKEFKAQQMDLETQKNITTLLNKQLQTYQPALDQRGGSVFIRWGRNICPSTASLVYKGYTAGKHYNRGGSGPNNLCLPSDPTWSKYQTGSSYMRGYIYGTEIDTDDSHHIFNYPVRDQDLPCAVCQSNKSSTMMIPARNNCYNDWTMEYHGYLMAGVDGHQAYDFICIDENPEFLQRGGTDDNQHILYLIEGICGSLPCPPYVNERELACVVCSK